MPNEDFLRAEEALRLHGFTLLDPSPGSVHYFEGLEHYAAQHAYPAEIIERCGSELTLALFPASFVGWKLAYVPVRDPQDTTSFTTSLAVEKISLPAESDVEHSFIELSRTSSRSVSIDGISLASDDSTSTVSVGARDESEDEYIVIRPYSRRQQQRSMAVTEPIPMERGNGPLSPSESVCDIADMKTEYGMGAVEMLPGQKTLEKKEGVLTILARGLFVPGADGLKESFQNAREYLRRDGTGWSKFAKQLDGWSNLLAQRNN